MQSSEDERPRPRAIWEPPRLERLDGPLSGVTGAGTTPGATEGATNFSFHTAGSGHLTAVYSVS